MPTYTEISRDQILLADNTPCDIVHYVETDENGNDTTLQESQVLSGSTYYCWQISSSYLVAQDTVLGYMQQNSQGALPRPKPLNNPGGSPVKY